MENKFSNNIKYLRKLKKLSLVEMAAVIGKGKSIVGNYENGENEPSLDVIFTYSNYFGINLEALLTQDLENEKEPLILDENMRSNMRSNVRSNLIPNPKIYTENTPTSNVVSHTETVYKQIPLIPTEAFAGMASGDVTITDIDITRYVVPEFNDADFLIKVKGSSMYPKYNSGDVLACKYVKDSFFIQWGKVYVLDSTQGALVKRLFAAQDTEHIECRSDNQAFPPFAIPKNEIRAMALVIGVIRLE